MASGSACTDPSTEGGQAASGGFCVATRQLRGDQFPHRRAPARRRAPGARAPPFGDQDALHDRVADYVARLKAAGKAVELVVFAGQGHGFFVTEPCNSFENVTSQPKNTPAF
ncbi:hypothetical protein E2562_025915 [Oryza meyeriana var. granulata]|uniref:Alpha/beta hydrolase fold-3 domain-containing protein n=1 Tax=Oryza meyeriana var. granulata TaxID=110450 RepID=A0A6G1CIE5_9ORYZ|nr:hypothetical protein E2562_025915 [Oryza meyeriana var. granulata]